MTSDDLDAKLIAERSRTITLLADLATAIIDLPPERLAEVLPGLQGLDDVARHARRIGLEIPNTNMPNPRGNSSISRD